MAAVRVFISLLLIVHYARAQKSSENSTHVLLSPQTLISFLLLGLTVTLSGSVYLWILRYVCIGCCQPVAVGPESGVGGDGVNPSGPRRGAMSPPFPSHKQDDLFYTCELQSSAFI